MAALESNLKSNSNTSLVEKILEQGQRLRNSMVQAVLNNDPFNKEILSNISSPAHTYRDNKSVRIEKCNCYSHRGKGKRTQREYDQLNIHKYLEGDEMCVNEEMRALETLRSMSPHSLIQSTSCTKHSDHYKDSCDICKDYENRLYSASTSSISIDKSEEKYTSNRSKLTQKSNDKHTKERADDGKARVTISEETEDRLKSTPKDDSSKLKLIKNTFHENQGVLRYVDSLKIHVYSLKLNGAGHRKVSASENANKPYLIGNNMYFVEYSLPDVLLKQVPKSRAKVNTGLHPDKTIRFCSKKLLNDSVYFRQQSMHQISNVNMLDLSSIKIEFRVSFRCVKQRTALLIGIATINLGSLITNRFLSSEQELVIVNENAPVVLGTLKVMLQFGCDKLYFGKEFIDAISCSKENTKLSDSDSIYKISDTEQASNLQKQKSNKVLTSADQNISQNLTKSDVPVPSTKVEEKSVNSTKDNEESHLLYALIHISEVRVLSNPVNSYLICRGFTRDDTFTSKTVYNSYNPVFNLYQLIPVLLNEDFVNRLRDNYIIVELWEKKVGLADCLIGITKLSLHQLYVAYRNPAIVKHLAKNQHPVIGIDWWETVTDPVSNSDYGQIRAIIALGTQSQVEALEVNRKLKQATETITPKSNYTDNVHDLQYNRLPQTSTTSINDYNQTRRFQPVVKFITKEDNNVTTGLPKAVIEIEDSRKSALEHRKIGVEKEAGLSSRTGLGSNLNRNRFLEDNSNFTAERQSNWKTVLQEERNRNIPETRFNTQLERQSSRQTIFEDELSSKAALERQRVWKTFLDKEPTKRTILVSDKYVQEPEIEISPSVTSLTDRVKETNRSSQVDASTQSETVIMESENIDNKTPVSNTQFSQRDFFNSFLEQLISTRDLNQRNRHVENSTNTEDYLITDTARTNFSQNALPEVSKAVTTTSITDTRTQEQNTTTTSNITNPLYVNTTFPQSSIVNNTSSINSNLLVRNTSDLLDSLNKALSVGNKNEQNQLKDDNSEDTFKVHIVIESALHLPSRKKCKSKRNKTKGTKSNEEILPSTYVTFKSYPESGDCITTPIVSKSTSPRWDFRCDTRLPSELLINNQKRLIFKVWRKANGPSLQPNFDTDIVLGFAALDLTVLLSGLPNVQGWFNIVDFSSKCNGQIKIHVTPLENLSKFNEYKRTYVPEKIRIENVNQSVLPVPVPIPDPAEETIPADLLSRALKRKFTELDEITQRLRQRLSAVTNDDSDISNDDFIDEFERDLNTECADTEGLINFDDEMDLGLKGNTSDKNVTASCSKVKSTSDILNEILNNKVTDAVHNLKSSSLQSVISDSTTSIDSEPNLPTVHETSTQRKLTELDTHLTDGKLKIDSLLEKLTLLTGENDNQNKSDRSFSSRYVSGCSINQEVDSTNNSQVLKDIELKYKDNLDPDLIFNPMLFQQMFTVSMDSTPRLEDSLECNSSVRCTTLKSLVNDSSSSGSTGDLQSIGSDINVTRPAPDGAGNMSGEARL